MSDTDDNPLQDLVSELAQDDVKEETVEQQDTTTEAPSAEENKEEAEVVADTETDTEGESAEEEADATTEETEEVKPLSAAEERKQQLNSEIRDLVTQRNNLRQQVEQINQQAYAPQTAEELVNEGYSETDARVLALEQREELRVYNEQVAEAQLVIGTESQRVLQDFPMFNPESPEYKPEVAQQAADVLRQSLRIDPNTGQVVGSSVSPYQLYQTIASANQASAVENQLAGQKATQQMLASAEPQSSAAPKQAASDPFLDGLLGKN